MKSDWKRGQAHVAELLDALKRRSWRELEQLPGYVDLASPPGLRRITFSQWRDTRPDGSLRIVVQQYRSGVIAGRMAADGFVAHQDGRVTTVPQDELWEYT